MALPRSYSRIDPNPDHIIDGITYICELCNRTFLHNVRGCAHCHARTVYRAVVLSCGECGHTYTQTAYDEVHYLCYQCRDREVIDFYEQ